MEKTTEETKNKLAQMPVGRLLISLAAPAIAAQLVNLLYNMVDRIYIGHIPGIGAAALTGVGLFAPILMLNLCLCSPDWLWRGAESLYCHGKRGLRKGGENTG